MRRRCVRKTRYMYRLGSQLLVAAPEVDPSHCVHAARTRSLAGCITPIRREICPTCRSSAPDSRLWPDASDGAGLHLLRSNGEPGVAYMQCAHMAVGPPGAGVLAHSSMVADVGVPSFVTLCSCSVHTRTHTSLTASPLRLRPSSIILPCPAVPHCVRLLERVCLCACVALLQVVFGDRLQGSGSMTFGVCAGVICSRRLFQLQSIRSLPKLTLFSFCLLGVVASA